MESFDVIVIGGGIAGLSTAWHLARGGAERVCVLEREWACGTRASGTNAAIFRHFDADSAGVKLAARSGELLEELRGEDGALLRRTGALYLAARDHLAAGVARLEAEQVAVQVLSREEVQARAPYVSLRDGEQAAFVPGDGVLDTHAVLQALQQRLRAAGAVVRTTTDVTTLSRGASFEVNRALATPKLVLAGGAWNESLGALLDAPLGLVPLRRHLALLETRSVDSDGPVVWRLDDEVYFRPESGGVLASPCDETKWPASGTVPTDAGALARLGELLSTLAPSLAGAQVRRAWGCLRTFAPDRELVAGADSRVNGLFWCAGLGGRGMSCGLALGEVVAASVLGRTHPLAATLAPRGER